MDQHALHSNQYLRSSNRTINNNNKIKEVSNYKNRDIKNTSTNDRYNPHSPYHTCDIYNPDDIYTYAPSSPATSMASDGADSTDTTIPDDDSCVHLSFQYQRAISLSQCISPESIELEGQDNDVDHDTGISCVDIYADSMEDMSTGSGTYSSGCDGSYDVSTTVDDDIALFFQETQ